MIYRARAHHLLSTLVLLVLSASCFADKPRLFAVLIGLGNYNFDKQGFGHLDGANDVRKMHDFLLHQVDHAVDPQIKDLTTSDQTTKANIEKVIESNLITNPNIRPGDVVVLFYSGHGAQVVIDGKVKQAIIPIDVKRIGSSAGVIDPDSVIAGPEIGKWIKAIEQRTNNVTFIFDSCSSASITRGAAIAKTGRINPAVKNAQVDPISKDTSIGPAVVFSAALPEESAYEAGDGYGNLTTALVNSAMFLSHDKGIAEGSGITYEEVKKRLDVEILKCDEGQEQHPQIQTSDLRREFLGTATLNPPEHMDVTYDSEKGLFVHGGELRGLSPGVIVGLYPANTTDFTQAPNAQAKVKQEVEGDTSLELLTKDKPGIYDGYWAIITDGAPNGMVNVCLDDVKSSPKYAALAESLASLKYVKLGDLTHYDCRITPPDVSPAKPKGTEALTVDAVPGKWTITSSNGTQVSAFDTPSSPDDLKTALEDEIINASKYKSVKALKPSGLQPLRIEAKLVRVETTGPDQQETVSKIIGPFADPTDARNQGRFAIVVRALGMTGQPSSLDSYIAVMDLTPKKRVTQAWPDIPFEDVDKNLKLKADGNWYYLGIGGSYVKADNRFQPADVSQVYAWYFDPEKDGEGEEMFKVFATDVPQDYADLLSRSAREGARGAETELGKLLKMYSTGQVITRGDPVTKAVSSFSMASTSADIRVARK